MANPYRFTVLEKALERRTLVIPEEHRAETEQVRANHDEVIDQLFRRIVDEPEVVIPSLLNFLVQADEGIGKLAPRSFQRYSYIAKHLHASMNGELCFGTEYLTVEEWCIEDTFNAEQGIFLRLFDVDRDNFFETFYEALLQGRLDSFHHSAAMACHMVHLGLPLYISEDDAMREVDHRMGEIPFIKGMGKYFYLPSEFSAAPTWMTGLNFKRSDIERHYLIFSQPNPPTPEEETTLRKAYRASLGLSDDETTMSAAAEPTKLSKHASAMVRHFQGMGYRQNGREDWPLQKEVVFWLTTNCGVSNREAEAIDLVTRPDHLRMR